jgi:hypothetical protein
LRSPLSALFARMSETRAVLEELLTYGTDSVDAIVAQLRLCRASAEECLEWKGANDRERSVRAVSDNALRSCLDALRMAELGLVRDRRDMVEAANRNLASTQERLLGIARTLQE